MKALTLLRPWDGAILYLGKNVENRKWHPPEALRGQRIALHAGKGWDEDGRDFILRLTGGSGAARIADSLARHSLIVATVQVVDWQRYDAPEIPSGRTFGPWAFGPWCWWLADVFALLEPVPCKGALGLWRLPPDVEARVIAQEAARG